MSGMGIALGDYDLDGDLDMYVTNIGVNVFLRNDGEGIRFSNVTTESAAGIPNVGREPAGGVERDVLRLRQRRRRRPVRRKREHSRRVQHHQVRAPAERAAEKTRATERSPTCPERAGRTTQGRDAAAAISTWTMTDAWTSSFQLQRKPGAAEERLRQRQPLAEAEAHGKREQSRRHRREDHRDRQRRQPGAPHIWRLRPARPEYADSPLWPRPGNERRKNLCQVGRTARYRN